MTDSQPSNLSLLHSSSFETQKPSRAKRGIYGRHLYDFQPAILRTNKRINSEARRFLYDENLFVRVRYSSGFTDSELLTRGLTLLADEEDDERCSSYPSPISLRVDLIHHGRRKLPLKLNPIFMMAAQELEVLCKYLEKFDQEWPGFLMDLKVKVGIFPRFWSSRPFPQQRILLEPFNILHSVNNFEIISMDGNIERIDATLMKEVKEKAGGLPPSIEGVVIAATKIEDYGNEAFRAGDFWHAAALYKSAWDDLGARHYYYRQRLSNPAEFFESDRGRLHVRLRLWVATLLCLQLWNEAHKTATQEIKSIAGIKDFGSGTYCGPSDLAKLYYLRAQASEGMGKLTQAVEDIREALRFDPNNMEMKTKWEKWAIRAK